MSFLSGGGYFKWPYLYLPETCASDKLLNRSIVVGRGINVAREDAKEVSED